MSVPVPIWIAAIVGIIIGINQAYMGKWWGWLLIVGCAALEVIAFLFRF